MTCIHCEGWTCARCKSPHVVADQSPSLTWPLVLAFAQRMEAKLDKNRHKGNREGWRTESTWALLDRLDEEVAELKAALREGRIDEIPDEAADVANFALMIADVAGGVAP